MRVLFERTVDIPSARMAARTIRARPDTSIRAAGAHVQEINRRLAVAAGKLEDRENGFSGPSYPLLPAMGVAWEEFVVSLFSEDELVWQPAEMEVDGISGNVDGLWWPDNAIWECKLTTAKQKRIQDCWLYLKQGLAYCKLWGLQRVLYDVNWILGDYMRPYQPCRTQTLIEFDEGEVDQWWQRMLKEKNRS